jgi:ABC-type microcin C transport system permease subunit YejE
MISTKRAEQDARRVEQQDVNRYYSMNENDRPRRITPPSDDYYLGLILTEGTHQEEQFSKMEDLLFQRKMWRRLSILLFLIVSASTVIGKCLDPSPQRRQRQGVERPPMVTVLWITAILSWISFVAVFAQFFVVQRRLDDFRGKLVLRNYYAEYSPPTAGQV